MLRKSDIEFDRRDEEQRQKCKVCGCTDKFDFHILDKMWKKVVPARFRNKVVCLACFDEFAYKRGIDYSDALDALYFAGDRVVFKFEPVSADSI